VPHPVPVKCTWVCNTDRTMACRRSVTVPPESKDSSKAEIDNLKENVPKIQAGCAGIAEYIALLGYQDIP
jgi:hypothetical protein